jgi:hypothetical protein
MIGAVVFGFGAKGLFITEANRHDACPGRTSDVRALYRFYDCNGDTLLLSQRYQIGEERDPSVLCRGRRCVDDPSRRMW